MDTLHDALYTFMIKSGSVFLRMNNALDKSCRENRNTHFPFSNFFFLENLTIEEILWENIVEPDRPQVQKWRMRVAC
jgi:hypothetical protein